ncbi:lysophospholipid acyltransferase family protein [Campylobacter sp. RM9344]|uniref:Lysophospholipid acyltransferase family protein n=1 Tax=Campylobacter californiensis TaxID=1032243 RepID=A0AAW3ZV09_9BACT|nr:MULTISPECIES: lysophospholipid acyltransferase family protein [unclassified Campylobacter]MBE2983996.1 lysophospholipid acyltransferase family protein [Campylobacter sp. RM6883]MBE2986158.1 lysophospholipid acyltransferase family protein [Campylobacter sp. RM12919]MBE2987570.1 lysophospholipid acyltransferase family protein [Campylobacter sp. RM12920]MBE2994534.1 lysophospholipid acyltransferase family protein [Campylobacter sp. RM6913]MBE3030081.1 lysophospholipid acyltransferase family pr
MANLWSRAKKSIFINFSVWAIYLLMRIIFLTCKKTYTDTRLPKHGCVVVFWHGRLAMMSFAYLKFWTKDFNKQKHGKVIISDHKDGEIIARIIKFFGIDTIRGSSSKGGAKALITALKEIKSGVDVIITPDGPRGPRHSIADGAVVIAQKTNSKIYVLNYEADKFWQLKSWDKMIIPKPFSTINFSLSAPFKVDGLELDDAKELIQENLWKASQKDGGKSVEENKSDFVANLKVWWVKNANKNR